MLEIWILNVNHGDSIVIRFSGPSGPPLHAVVDSNKAGSEPPKALRKLWELQVDRLDFVALTHLHADHYFGLPDILAAYRGNLTTFYTPPLAGEVRERRKKLRDMYKKLFDQQDSEYVRNRLADLIRLIGEAHRQHESGALAWIELDGTDNCIFERDGLRISILLPHKKYKGHIFQLLDSDEPECVEEAFANDLSLAFKLQFAGHEIVLGGDATYRNWMEHRNVFDRQGRKLNACVAKLPHHGSASDCAPAVLDYVFRSTDQGRAYAIISANGRTHPSPQVLKQLEVKSIHPFCTNLSKACGANISALFNASGVDAATTKFINALGPEAGPVVQSCQGDICVRISERGDLEVRPQFANLCGYRGPIQGIPQIA